MSDSAAPPERTPDPLPSALSDEACARLADSAFFVVGAGAIGGVAAALLTAAGAGRVAIVDGSSVSRSDLSRQIFFLTPEAGMAKPDGLAAKLSLLNPDVHVDPFPADLTAENARHVLAEADCVLDCSSDENVRLVVNDSCVAACTPFVSGATAGFDGLVLPVRPGETACWRCLDSQIAGADSIAALEARVVAGAFGPTAAIVGAMQAHAAIALVTGDADARPGVVRRFRGRDSTWAEQVAVRTRDCICARGSDDGNL